MRGTIHTEKLFTAFGPVKGRLTGINRLLGGHQTVGIGGVAAAAAFVIARGIG